MTSILQISDPHLLSQPNDTLKGVPTSQSLQWVLERAREEVADPVRVVLTGDLSHEHSIAGYELLRDLLADWTERSLLIPGNHDDRQGLRRVFGQVPGEADDDVCFRDELGNWLLIGLDSHVPGKVHGELSDATLAQLHSWLLEDPKRPTLIFLHHPPMPVNSAWIDKIGLRNSGALETLVRRNQGVRGIFCGHIHQVFESDFAGVPIYSAPSTSYQFTPETEGMEIDFRPPGFRVIEIQTPQFSTRVVRLDEVALATRSNQGV